MTKHRLQIEGDWSSEAEIFELSGNFQMQKEVGET